MADFEGDLDTILRLMKLHEEERLKLFHQAAAESASAGVGILVQAAPKDMGLLRQSVHVEKNLEGFDLVVGAPHSVIVELGARPHMPPFEPIFQWVERHFPGNDVSAITHAIRKKIATRGLQPTHFVLGSLPKLIDMFLRRTIELFQKS